jgi:sugar transferase (PEP-CTERM/EpsH1 system associated)
LFWEPQLSALLQRWQKEHHFAASLVSASSLYPYQATLSTATKPHVDLVDVDSQKWFDFAAASSFPKSWLYRSEGKRILKLEQQLAKHVGIVSLVSHAEAKVFDDNTTAYRATVATNGVDLAYFQPEPATETVQACAFVGAMDYLPNIDAATCFVAEIWPTLRQRFPYAEFWIIGRKPTQAVLQLKEHAGVVIHADVPDVRPYVRRASLAVCPIRIARGLQNKVLEAMALGKAVLASPAATAALNVNHGDELYRPTTPQEWIDNISHLWKHPEVRQQLGERARNYTERYHHWDECLQPLINPVVGISKSHD